MAILDLDIVMNQSKTLTKEVDVNVRVAFDPIKPLGKNGIVHGRHQSTANNMYNMMTPRH